MQETTTLAYDAAGDLLSKTTGQSANPAYAHVAVTDYGYDALNRLTVEVDAAGNVAQATTTLAYDGAGNLLSKTTGQAADPSYAHVATTNYGYDALHRLTQEVQAAGSGAASTTGITYDSSGNLRIHDSTIP